MGITDTKIMPSVDCPWFLADYPFSMGVFSVILALNRYQ